VLHYGARYPLTEVGCQTGQRRLVKNCFQKSGNQLRFTWTVDGKEKSFEFYWEPFEGSLKDNIETFSKWFSEGDTRKKFYAVNLLAQAKDESAIPTLIAAV